MTGQSMKGRRILIVDDNEANLYLLRALLEGHGCEVATATNGANALDVARQNLPDLIVSDVLMPVMDGFALCREWKKDARLRTIPFVFYTATYTDERDEQFGLSLGAERFVVKPEEPDVLLAIICEAIQRVGSPPAGRVRPASKAHAGSPNAAPEADEASYLALYNKTLVRKLEAKMAQLEQANLELRESRRDLEEAQRVAHVGSWTLDQRTGSVTWSPEMYRILELDPDGPALGFAEMSTVLSADSLGLVTSAVERAIQTGEPWNIVCEMAQPDGARGWVAINGIVEHDPSGAMTGIHGTLQDVTERERTLAALKASERHARELVDDSADGILVSGSDGRYVEANPAMCRILQYSREELLTMHAGDLTAADDPIGNVAMRERLAEPAGEAGILTERRYRRRDGTSVPVEVRFMALSDARLHRSVRDISERLAAEAVEVREARIRAGLTEALQHVAADATVEEAGQAICDALSTLPGVDFTSIDAFLGEGEVTMLAGTLPSVFPSHPGDALPPERARYLQARAAQGPWADYSEAPAGFGPGGDEIAQTGVRAAVFGPIVHGDHVDGLLVIGTADEAFTHTLVERMPGLAAFTATSSGLLAERLHARRREAELRAALTSVLSAAAFHPVFQPIVDLESREVVGYEALSRFDSGQQPDRCFADAWSVGLGPDLELATAEMAVAAARRLPAGRWLDVNVSPRLFRDPDRFRALFLRTERPIVIEITEHETISDYGAIREVIHGLGNDVRLAVDDAGAGIANFGHIIELRPDLVKLDISIVRSVNTDLGRQAVVVGMRYFARTAGCRLVAEGIEIEAEAATLAQLGVKFGQGYLFGHPEPVEAWAATRKKA
jgi:PAS domain S-box-containing protein